MSTLRGFRVHQLEPEPGTTDGQGPVYDAASDRVIWADPPLGSGSGIQSIVPGSGISVDNTDPENPVVSATGTGGGGGGGSVPDLRWTVGTGETSIDEFDDGYIDPAWIRVDGAGAAAANVDYVEAAGSLSVRNVSGDSSQALHALLRPIGTALAPGDGFITSMRIHGRLGMSHSMGGLILADGTTHGAGAQVTADASLGASGGYNYDTVQYSWANFTYIPGTGTIDQRYSPAGAPLFLRLWMTAANAWQVDTSANGVLWHRAGYGPRTLTPTHVGFMDTSYGTSAKHIAVYEFLRRVSGVS